MNSIHTFLLIFLQEGHESSREKHIASAPLSFSHTNTIPPSRQNMPLVERTDFLHKKSGALRRIERHIASASFSSFTQTQFALVSLVGTREEQQRERERERRTESMKGTREKRIMCCDVREKHIVCCCYVREKQTVWERSTLCAVHERKAREKHIVCTLCAAVTCCCYVREKRIMCTLWAHLCEREAHCVHSCVREKHSMCCARERSTLEAHYVLLLCGREAHCVKEKHIVCEMITLSAAVTWERSTLEAHCLHTWSCAKHIRILCFSVTRIYIHRSLLTYIFMCAKHIRIPCFSVTWIYMHRSLLTFMSIYT